MNMARCVPLLVVVATVGAEQQCSADTTRLVNENKEIKTKNEALRKHNSELLKGKAVRAAFTTTFTAELEGKRGERTHLDKGACTSFQASEMTADTFFNKIYIAAAPVTIKGGVKFMGNLSRWMDLSYLEKKFGNTRHAIKYAFSDVYVQPNQGNGVGQLEHPYTKEITLSKYLKEIRGSEKDMHSFVEQSSLVEGGRPVRGMKVFLEDIQVPAFASFLTAAMDATNFWFGTHARGKPKQSALHFDPFDNVLAQLIGEKEFVMFDAFESQRVYPKRMAQVERMEGRNNKETKAITDEGGEEDGEDDDEDSSQGGGENKLNDNFSPVLVDAPDKKRFPRFDKSRAIKCRLQPGDLLYMPAFTWHNVYSWRNETSGVNAAMNYWFKPLDNLAAYHTLVHDILLESNAQR